jgi:2,3-bisphosphoglycerate-independent phosphoglycerate mutase
MAESEKERFVTYYFNGMRETPFPYEDRIIIPSKKVATYDTVPAMSAHEITEALVKQIMLVKYKFILVNFANADIIGHTGNFSAALSAIAVLDRCVGIIVNTALQYEYTVMLTADHGNIEEMIDLKTGGVSTEHSANPVPLIIANNTFKNKFMYLYEGVLADVAPTILSLMDITKPSDMTGSDLLKGRSGSSH